MINVLIVDDEKIEREGLKYLICAGSNTLWCHGIYPETGKSRGFSPSDPACGGDNCQSDKEGKS